MSFKLKPRNVEKMNAIARQDISILNAMFASNAVLIFSNAPKLAGHNAIVEAFNSIFVDGLNKLNLGAEHIYDYSLIKRSP